MDDQSAPRTGIVEPAGGRGPTVGDDYLSPRNYPYLNAVEGRRRRKRAGLVWLGIGLVLAAALVVVMLLPRSVAPGERGPAESAAAPATAARRTTTAPGSTTSRVPTTGAEVVAAAAPTTVPPPPTATITLSPVEMACNEGATETATVLSWTSSDAETALVTGPGGQISTMASGNREVVPSRPCAEAPFDDRYSFSVRNGSGAAAGEATVTWTAVDAGD